MDHLSRDERSRLMASIRGKDTKPEIAVRRLVHRMGYRFRLHRRDLPGHPDLVLLRHRTIILVHGCFWHRHHCRMGRSVPRTRTEFWQSKFDYNVSRDRRNIRQLRRAGWHVLVVWECEVRDLEKVERRIRRFLDGPQL